MNDAKVIKEISPEESISPEVQQLMREFSDLFKRKGRVKNYEINIDTKDNAKVSQQKGRRIPFQLQDQIDKEIEKLLKTATSKRWTKFKMTYLFNQQSLRLKRINR